MRKYINVCYVTLSGGNKIIVADFSEGSKNPRGKYFDLTVTVSEGGVVTSYRRHINCGSGNTLCTHNYGKNIAVTLTATPNSGYIFLNAGSLGGCSGRNNINTCQVKMTKNQNVKFYFGASSSSSSSTFAKPRAATTVNLLNFRHLKRRNQSEGKNVLGIFFIMTQDGKISFVTEAATIGSKGSSEVSVSANISGLSPNKTYYLPCRAYITDPVEDIYGKQETFTTLEGPSSSSSGPASVDLIVTSSSVSILCQVQWLLTGNTYVILTWTDGGKNCSISYSSNAKTDAGMEYGF